MSDFTEVVQSKCLAFSDRIIKLNDYLLKEAANAKKPSNIVLWVLAVFGAIAAVATIAYFVFQYMMPEYEDDYDFDDDDFDDFDDDFVDLDLEK